MSVLATRVTATTDATALAACAAYKVVDANIKNAGAINVYLGSSGLSSTDGYRLGAGQSIGLTLRNGETIYGISTSTDGTACDVLRTWDAT